MASRITYLSAEYILPAVVVVRETQHDILPADVVGIIYADFHN